MSNWLTYSPISGHGNGTITITAETLSSLEDRVATIIASNSQYSVSDSVLITQYKANPTGVSISNLTWVTDVPASGGTATKDNCSYVVYLNYDNGMQIDVTSAATVSGSLNVAATTTVDRHSAGTLTLSASYSGFTNSENVTVYQAAPSITGISFNNLTWVTDIAGTGGTATSANCSFNIYAYYTNGGSNYVDVTNASTVSGSETIPLEYSYTRHSAGTLTLVATYSTFSVSSSTTIYQEAYEMPVPTADSSTYLTLLATDDGVINFKMYDSSNHNKTIQYSKNGGSWVSITSQSSNYPVISVNANDIIRFKGNNTNYADYEFGVNPRYSYLEIKAEGYLYGNIMSMIGGDNFSGLTQLTNDYAFSHFFRNSDITNVENLLLPATTLTKYCYDSLFRNCTGITTSPELPATTLADYCYRSMFQGCSSLTTAPALHASYLMKPGCYAYMFAYCTSLVTPPVMNLTAGSIMYDSCCYGMFMNCTGLTTTPALPSLNTNVQCYDSMFVNCVSLTAVPELPSEWISTQSYGSMFRGCTGLTTLPSNLFSSVEYVEQDGFAQMFKDCTNLRNAPELPATDIGSSCYWGMFANCTSLTGAPTTLPATTLDKMCYAYMFSGCTSLTTAPELPAVTLDKWSYNEMFKGCTSLNYIKCLATDISAEDCLTNWVDGVSATGTFIKDPNMSSWTTGVDGIPSGWTVQDAT